MYSRGMREWLSADPFPPILSQSFPFPNVIGGPSHSPYITKAQFPFPPVPFPIQTDPKITKFSLRYFAIHSAISYITTGEEKW
jgi:hypothetical protein